MGNPPNPNPIATELADKYCAEWPNQSTRGLARRLAQENPLIFTSEEHARKYVRYRRGTTGVKSRRKRVAKFRNASIELPNPSNRFGLPESDEKDWLPYHVKVTKPERVLVLSDIHIPYHSMVALQAAIQDGIDNGCTKVLLNGDTVDCYMLSRFQKDPRLRDFKGEVESTKKFLDALRKAFPDAEIIWKDGNHDERLAAYLCERVPEIVKLGLVNWPAILGFGDRGITYVSEKRPLILGKLVALHGHELPKGISSPVNSARGLFLRVKVSALAGHLHRSGEHTEADLFGNITTTWGTGCLCELHPQYMPINGWNWGHAVVELHPDDRFNVWNKRILKTGKVY